MTDSVSARIRFDDDGLVPVVVQDAITNDVLMLAFMNGEALQLTQTTGEAHYWSRSRQRLWRKGERSGHTQAVEEIRINCELNSLLLRVRQTGAVCHDGYPTCYYRQLTSDGSLTPVSTQVFDPESVYGRSDHIANARVPSPDDLLAEAARLQFGAYEFLKSNDLTEVSATSRRLRSSGEDFSGRVGDELLELAGVLDGTHRHAGSRHDLLLEASQVVYWLIVECVRRGVGWHALRPDRALVEGDLRLERGLASRVLHAASDQWRGSVANENLAANAHATLALVAEALRSAGVDPERAIESDIEDLRKRPYLFEYFRREDAEREGSIERSPIGPT